ncbi:hypothetical protein B0T22DRAFT_486851 [Podospora appendiculata]|uniref:Apple domain-containing protein n=1 Tax=Podospora appendiculata TaxID=314037 RepID=A0AAE0XGV8_9PEZI|nr:hypothetical protein B0T22DRAFT_486851 [Podospora appendiculata]
MDHQNQQPADHYQFDSGAEKAAAAPAPLYLGDHPSTQQDNVMYRPSGSGPALAASGATSLRIKRSVALAVVIVAGLLLFAVIGLASGLGVSQRNLHQAQDDLASALGGAAAASATTTSSPAAAAPTATAASFACPNAAGNGTLYTSSATSGSKQFQRFCGIDFGPGESTDLGSAKTESLDACLDACAAKPKCTGAGWGVIAGDTSSLHSCWMKTNLTRSHEATPEWGFGRLVQGG